MRYALRVHMADRQQLRALSSPVAGGAPPTSFRIFAPGVNETSRGPFIFDATAARNVMAAYKRAAVDLPVDLDHESLGPATRPDSRDARGWFKLAVRPDGSLWAVDVKWTPDGLARLANKTQRYISPAFTTDAEGRITEIVNCALVAMPATHGAMPLVAAAKLDRRHSAPVGIRLERRQITELRAVAGALGISLSALARRMLAESSSQDALLGALRSLLDLPATATADDVVAAVESAVSSNAPAPSTKRAPAAKASPKQAPEPHEGAAVGEGADPKRPASLSYMTGHANSLSKREAEACKRLGISREELRSRKAKAVRRRST